LGFKYVIFLYKGSVKTKPDYPILTVGAGFACPKTQSKLFSGERTSPLRTKRQHYPRFDNLFLLYRVTYPFLSLAGRGIFVQRVTTWKMEYGKN